MDDAQHCEPVVARALLLGRYWGSESIGPFAAGCDPG
jgi:hypothetical protein